MKTSPEHDFKRQVAAATLLLSAARVDGSVTAGEVAHILEHLRQQFGLSPEQARQRLSTADRNLDGPQGLTQAVAHSLSVLDDRERLRLVAELRGVIYADGVATAEEAALLADLSQLMGLSRSVAAHEARRRLRATLTPNHAPGKGESAEPDGPEPLLPHLRPPGP